MTIQPWWDEWPGLLEHELAELEQAGIRHELDSDFLKKHEIVRLAIWPVVDGVERQMWAYYPDLYPWFRPQVFSPDDDLAKHQNPFSKNLCLLPRESDAWRPGHDSLASIIGPQLRKVYASQGGPADDEVEVHQAEPFSEYYDSSNIGAFVVDSTWDLDDCDHGTFEFGLFQKRIALGEPHADQAFVGAVLSVSDERGSVVARANDAMAARFGERHRGRWQRLGAPLKTESAAEARAALRDHPHLAPSYRELPGTGIAIEVVAVVFPVEVEHGGAMGDAWMFLVGFAPPAKGKQKALNRRALIEQGTTRWFAGQRGGPDDLAVRVPQLGPVRGANVVLLGTGGVGAPAAEHLAQAGANVRLVDPDVIDVATSVRFPHGYADAGRLKTQVLLEDLARNWPTTEPRYLSMRVGMARLTGQREGEGQHRHLTELLDGADLIFDATADHAVGLLLSECAARLQLPFVNVSTTFGCWGGRVMALRPWDGPCFDCVYRHVDDRNGDGWDPEQRLVPPTEPGGEIRPAGCGDATYTGTSFDAAAIVAVGVRAAVSMLCAGQPGAYPPIDWNVATIWNRTHDGAPLAGRTFEFQLGRHEGCAECRRRSG